MGAAAGRLLSVVARLARVGQGLPGARGQDLQPDEVSFETDTKQFEHELLDLEAHEIQAARIRALARIAARGARQMKKLAPVDRGGVRQGIHERVYPAKNEARVLGRAKHTRPVLKGSRPHFPPRKPIQRWARRHGLPWYPVARAIARRGTPPHDFVTVPFENMVQSAPTVITQELRKATRRG